MEVEVKLALNDHKKAKEVLSKRGKFLRRVVEEDVYYNFDCVGGCCRNFAETDEAVRVRRKDGKCFLTYKGPRKSLEGVKAREEIEFEVGSCELADKFLEKMCLKPVAKVKKVREYWEVNGLLVTLDDVEGLGTFVEVEGDDPLKVRRLAEELFPGAKAVEKTYLEMLLEKLKA